MFGQKLFPLFSVIFLLLPKQPLLCGHLWAETGLWVNGVGLRPSIPPRESARGCPTVDRTAQNGELFLWMIAAGRWSAPNLSNRAQFCLHTLRKCAIPAIAFLSRK